MTTEPHSDNSHAPERPGPVRDHHGPHESDDHRAGHDGGGPGHEHGSGEHGHEHKGGPLAWVKEIFVPHSHDSTEKVDTALEASAAGMRCLKISFAALMVTALLQTVVVLLTNSVALLGDTLHNYADALTAIPIAIAFTVGRRVATRRYTYGYGRAEDLAGIVVVVLIAASAAFAGYESVRRLLDPQEVTHLWVVGVAGLVGFLGNEVVARYRIVVGRRIGSAALVADGLHARTDGFTSLAVVLGAIGVALGFPAADPIIGLLITVAILFVLRGATREIYRRLMDGIEPDVLDSADAAVRSVPGVEDVAELRLRWIGHSLRAEVGVVLDPNLSLQAAHTICHDVEHQLVHRVRRLTAAIVHADPRASDDAPDSHQALAHHRQA
ncbi:MAG: cation diffusion facilitator family transporter [Actinomycetota bacterium]|nr:cation diffusion facilitator family transporter [Actinomycetota bacterium]